MGNIVKVRALVDIPGTDIKSGEFFEASTSVAKGLVAVGDADDKAKEADVYPEGEIPAVKVHPSVEAAAATAAASDTPAKSKK